VCLRPDAPGAWAVDAELVTQPIPDALGARRRAEGGPDAGDHEHGDADPDAFWRAWTRAEVAAKLTGTPILAWVTTRGFGAEASGMRVWHRRIGDVLVCIGVRDGGVPTE